jgi:hypothetical protein
MNTPAKSQELAPVSQKRGLWAVGCYGDGILDGAATPRVDDLAAMGVRPLNFNFEAQCMAVADMGVTA